MVLRVVRPMWITMAIFRSKTFMSLQSRKYGLEAHHKFHQRWHFGLDDLILASNPNQGVRALAEEMRTRIESSDPRVRLQVAFDLDELARTREGRQRLAAIQGLEKLVKDDSRAISDFAKARLGERQEPEKERLEAEKRHAEAKKPLEAERMEKERPGGDSMGAEQLWEKERREAERMEKERMEAERRKRFWRIVKSCAIGFLAGFVLFLMCFPNPKDPSALVVLFGLSSTAAWFILKKIDLETERRRHRAKEQLDPRRPEPTEISSRDSEVTRTSHAGHLTPYAAHKLKGHTNWVRSVTFSPDGELLPSGSRDGTVRLWRVANGGLVRTLVGPMGWNAWISSVAFSPDGVLLASGSDDKTVRLWRVADGTPVRTLQGHTGWVTGVAFSPDGALLASGSLDKTVRLWRVADGMLVRTVKAGWLNCVRSVTFSSDGKLLASGSDYKTVRLWRVADGTLTHKAKAGWLNCVRSVTFSPDRELLASGGGDSIVRLWFLKEPINAPAFAEEGVTGRSGKIAGK